MRRDVAVRVDAVLSSSMRRARSTLNVSRQVNTAYDEIRIGTTLHDVLGLVPPPSGAVIVHT